MAAGAVVVAMLISGCAAGGDGASAAPSTVSATPTVEPTVTKATEMPFSTEDPYATEEPMFAEGPEGEVDKLAHEKGWSVDGMYSTASAFVKDICESLPVSAIQADSRPEWLVNAGHLEGDGKAVLLAGIPKLCPKWTEAVKQAASGKYDRWFGVGTFVVTSQQIDGEQTIPPGTYRAEGKMENCYWERTSESGDIIDNNFATSARKITVTIRASDGQFTSEGCEVWKPVK